MMFSQRSRSKNLLIGSSLFMLLLVLAFILTIFITPINCNAKSLPFSARLIPIKDKIKEGEKAIYSLILTNNQMKDDRIRLRFPASSYWTFITKPITASGIYLAPNQTKNITLYVIPIKGAKIYPMMYNMLIELMSTNTNISLPLGLNITYLFKYESIYEKEPNIDIKSVHIFCNGKETLNIDPRQSCFIRITIANKNFLELKNIDIHLKSLFLDKHVKTDLVAMQTKPIEIELDYPRKMLPCQDTLTFDIKVGNKTFGPQSIDVEIIGYKKTWEITTEHNISFLKHLVIIEIHNPGTLRDSQLVFYPISKFKKWFTKSEPRADAFIKYDGRYNFIWNLSLEPDEYKVIVITTNYFPLLYIFIILIVLVVAVVIVIVRSISPLSGTKKIEITQLKDGATTEIKVIITLKNKKNKIIKDVLVKDNIPSILDYVEKDIPGVLKPTRVVKHKRGTLLEWFIEHLEEHEERIIIYTLRAQFAVLGDLKLKNAKIKFKYRGKEWFIETKNID